MPSIAPTRSRALTSLGPAAPEALARAADEELVRLTWEGDGAALDALLDRYRGFVRLKARSYFLVGADREDVVQEGMVGLYKAIRGYDVTRQTSFRGFAELCVVRQIITAIKTATRQKHAPLNSYVSIHSKTSDDHDDAELGDQFDGGGDPVESILEMGEVAALRSYFGQILSELEAEVLQRYLDGESYAEIAEGLQRHVKSIDNAIQRIKRKLETYLADRQVVA
ncbi:RNA polymerase sporulation sigma factor SigH [soil metagenome]